MGITGKFSDEIWNLEKLMNHYKQELQKESLVASIYNGPSQKNKYFL